MDAGSLASPGCYTVIQSADQVAHVGQGDCVRGMMDCTYVANRDKTKNVAWGGMLFCSKLIAMSNLEYNLPQPPAEKIRKLEF